MRILKPEERLSGTGTCFLCETFINREADPSAGAIDTGRNFDPGFQTPLAGDKMVCLTCAEELGNTIGMIREESVVDAKIELDRVRQELVDLKGVMQGLLDSASDTASDLLARLPRLDQVSSVVTAKRKEDKENSGKQE